MRLPSDKIFERLVLKISSMILKHDRILSKESIGVEIIQEIGNIIVTASDEYEFSGHYERVQERITQLFYGKYVEAIARAGEMPTIDEPMKFSKAHASATDWGEARAIEIMLAIRMGNKEFWESEPYY